MDLEGWGDFLERADSSMKTGCYSSIYCPKHQLALYYRSGIAQASIIYYYIVWYGRVCAISMHNYIAIGIFRSGPQGHHNVKEFPRCHGMQNL